jgi:hypothetical protein
VQAAPCGATLDAVGAWNENVCPTSAGEFGIGRWNATGGPGATALVSKVPKFGPRSNYPNGVLIGGAGALRAKNTVVVPPEGPHISRRNGVPT